MKRKFRFDEAYSQLLEEGDEPLRVEARSLRRRQHIYISAMNDNFTKDGKIRKRPRLRVEGNTLLCF